MSEKEILKRQKHRENRKKWLMIQAVAIAVMVAIALGSFLIYDRMDRTYYIEYTETSNIDYQVEYKKEADFFEENWRGEDQAYISFLIKNILADFHYEMNMGTSNVGFNYTYSITARMEVADKTSGNPYYTVEEVLLPSRQVTTRGGRQIKIDEQVTIDFQHFNDIAKEFTGVYGLKNASSTLIVTLDVQILSSSDQFEKNNENVYSTSINIPLNEETMSIFCTSSAPDAENKVLAYKTFVNKKIFFVMGYVTGTLAVIQVLALLVFLRITRNEDVTYTAKVRRLLTSYSSYIQRMDGEFDDREYQILMIKTFNELLGIRDTLQAPILMMENRDQTMSRFMIPTENKLLYVYDIRVDNFDELYGAQAGAVRGDRKRRFLKDENADK